MPPISKRQPIVFNWRSGAVRQYNKGMAFISILRRTTSQPDVVFESEVGSKLERPWAENFSGNRYARRPLWNKNRVTWFQNHVQLRPGSKDNGIRGYCNATKRRSIS